MSLVKTQKVLILPSLIANFYQSRSQQVPTRQNSKQPTLAGKQRGQPMLNKAKLMR